MNLTPSIIKELREKSGAGMMDCKKALDESGGNVENAIEWLRKKGINTAQKKSSRSASDGLITVKIDDYRGIIIEVNAETDFVARNENFQKFCDELALTGLKNEVENVESLLNCKFLDKQFKLEPNILEKNNFLPLTISGTIAIERALRGYKTAITGQAWFKKHAWASVYW